MRINSSRRLLRKTWVRLALVTLAFAAIATAALLWVANMNAEDLSERQAQWERDIVEIKLHDMQRRVQDIFQAMYQNSRTIALLPGLQSLTGANRLSVDDQTSAMPRFGRETDRTIQQIFNNLEANVAVSEVYAVMDGFDATRGEVPLFMYDTVKVDLTSRSGGQIDLAPVARAIQPGQDPDDVPQALEDQEYAYFPTQLQALKSRHPRFDFASLNQIPAISSPLIHTCDNQQYYSKAICDVNDTAGMLYSLPFYHEKSGAFSGIVSVIVRANVFEAALVGVPFLVLTPRDVLAAQAKQFSMPAEHAPFALVNPTHGTLISDRRNPGVLQAIRHGAEEGGKLFSVSVPVVDQSPWMLYYYATPQDATAATASVRASNTSRLWMVGGFLCLLYGFTVGTLGYQLRASRKLHAMATVDGLTGLPNRGMLVDRIGKSIARSKRMGGNTAVFFIDLNKFKAINDSLGHGAGDLVLQEVARRLLGLARQEDTVGRLGGDEFVMVCELDREDDAVKIGERLGHALSQPIRLGQNDYGMGASVGVAVYPLHAQGAEALLRRADIAMYQAKKNQNSTVQWFDESMQDAIDEQLHLQENLRTAIGAGELVLHFQPQVEFASGKLVGFEALVRWQSPIYGFMPPGRFIPVAEESGLIAQIDDWVMDAACAQIRAWRAAGLGDRRVSINLAATKFAAPSFLEDLGACLARHGVQPGQVELEITESLAIANPELAIARMKQLRAMQVELAIDDFGTGYSNLSNLSRYPANRLKIDQSFVRAMLHSRQDWALVATIVELARNLGVHTIAEGVETLDQARALYQMGVHEMQGYWIGKPMPPSALVGVLTKPRLFDPEQLREMDTALMI